jgi:hypothetical protein
MKTASIVTAILLFFFFQASADDSYPIDVNGARWIAIPSHIPAPQWPDGRIGEPSELVLLVPPRGAGQGSEADAVAAANVYAVKYMPLCLADGARPITTSGWVVRLKCPPTKATSPIDKPERGT